MGRTEAKAYPFRSELTSTPSSVMLLWSLRAPFTAPLRDRKSTRLNSSHSQISYAVFCLKKKKPTVAAPAVTSVRADLSAQTPYAAANLSLTHLLVQHNRSAAWTLTRTHPSVHRAILDAI